MKVLSAVLLIFLGQLSKGQSRVVHLQIVIDSTEYKYYKPKDVSKIAAPQGGYDKFFNDFMNSVLTDPRYKSSLTDTRLTFTVFNDGRLGRFSTEKPSTKKDSLFISHIVDMGNWSPHTYEPQRVSLSIITEGQEVFIIVEEPARFPGGEKAFDEFLLTNLKYPADAQRLGVEGRVFIQFIVEKDGSISNSQVVKGIGAGCDEEALRVINAMPDWIPGKQRGTPIRQKMLQNIMFKFSDRTPKKKKRKRKRN